MAGIPPVNYNGREYTIDKSNAKMLYVAYRKGELKLDDSSEAMQVQRMESLLTPADWDEIDYDMDLRKQEAAKNINTEGTDEGAGVGAAAASTGTAAAVGGTIVAICNGIPKLQGATTSNGFSSLACSIVAAAGAAIALAFSFEGTFDAASGDRKARSSESSSTNEEIQIPPFLLSF